MRVCVLVRLLVIVVAATEVEGVVDPVPVDPVHQDHDGSRAPSSAAFSPTGGAMTTKARSRASRGVGAAGGSMDGERVDQRRCVWMWVVWVWQVINESGPQRLAMTVLIVLGLLRDSKCDSYVLKKTVFSTQRDFIWPAG